MLGRVHLLLLSPQLMLMVLIGPNVPAVNMRNEVAPFACLLPAKIQALILLFLLLLLGKISMLLAIWQH